jgi:hypothetical protein
VLWAFPDDNVPDRVVITEVVILRQHADLRASAHRDPTGIRGQRTAND